MLILLRYAARTGHRRTALVLALALAQAGSGVLLTYLTGQVVGRVGALAAGGPIAPFAWILTALALVFLLVAILPVINEVTTRNWSIEAGHLTALELVEPMMTPRRIGHLSDPAVVDEQDRARGQSNFAVQRAVRSIPALLTSRASAVGSAVLIAALFSWWVVIVVLAGALLLEWYDGRVTDCEVDAWYGRTRGHRAAEYVMDLGMHAAPAELRVFGLQDWLVDRYVRSWRAAISPLWRARWRGLRIGAPLAVLQVLIVGGAVLLAAHSAAGGHLRLAALTATIPAILGLGNAANGFAVSEINRGVAAYRALVRYPALIPPEPVGSDYDLAAWREIRFENVGFRYPGTDRDVLSELNLTVRAGEALALVGVNGAGKSTFVKLLARVYSPTTGHILVDGVDIAGLSPDSLANWQRQIAAIVQDFVRFPLSVRDNVAFGAVDLDDAAALDSAAAEAGIASVVESYPDGWETVLDKAFVGGVDLSGGQWQRVALARALYAVRGGARILVLDEPAAALDVRAEAEMVDRYLQLTSGTTSLIISHRFSVVRDADRIAVLENGSIGEIGSHEELMELDGKYAALFRLQAERYTDA